MGALTEGIVTQVHETLIARIFEAISDSRWLAGVPQSDVLHLEIEDADWSSCKGAIAALFKALLTAFKDRTLRSVDVRGSSSLSFADLSSDLQKEVIHFLRELLSHQICLQRLQLSVSRPNVLTESLLAAMRTSELHEIRAKELIVTEYPSQTTQNPAQNFKKELLRTLSRSFLLKNTRKLTLFTNWTPETTAFLASNNCFTLWEP